MFLTHEWWSRNNGKYLKNLEKLGFSQNEIYHANGFSEVVSFRVFQCSRKRMSLIKVYFFTLQAVAQKQRSMLLKLKKDSFLKIRFIIQLSCVMLRFPIVLVFSEKHGFS